MTGQNIPLRTNQVKQMCGLIAHIKHIYLSPTTLPLIFLMTHFIPSHLINAIDLPDDPFHPFSPDKWAQHTPTQIRTYLDQTLPNHHGSEPVPSGPISSTRPTGFSTAAIELMCFKKRIKREIASYPSLNDERDFDGAYA